MAPQRLRAFCFIRPVVGYGSVAVVARAAALSGLGGLRGAAFVDPADPGAGFHDDGPALVAREPEAVEHARVARGRAACLLDPAMQIIDGASGEILDRLDAVLAKATSIGGLIPAISLSAASTPSSRHLEVSASLARSAGALVFCAWTGLAGFRSQKNMAVAPHARARARF